MLKLDEFESAFNSAAKTRFELQTVSIDRILLVHDLSPEAVQDYERKLREYLVAITDADGLTVTKIHKSEYQNLGALIERTKEENPDVIVSYRNLGSEGWKWPYSLGEDLDVLTQATTVPVLVVPNPHSGRAAEHALQNTNSVMVVTDHLTGDDRLVSYGVRMTETGGTLHLTHVESIWAYDRFISMVAKIPEIDTDDARTLVREQAIKEPTDYISTVRQVLEDTKTPIKIEQAVLIGQRTKEYKRLISEHEVDLLILNTKDESQLAMHPVAYPIAVEIRDVPILML